MRKWSLLVLLSFMIFSLCACDNSKPATQEIPSAFTADFTARWHDKTYTGKWERTAVGSHTVTFQSPEGLQGMTVSYFAGRYSVSVGELTVESEPNFQNSFLHPVISALDSPNLTLQSKGEDSVTLSLGSSVITCNADGLPTRFVSKEQGIALDFSPSSK